jgi:hypothetical protein
MIVKMKLSASMKAVRIQKISVDVFEKVAHFVKLKDMICLLKGKIEVKSVKEVSL